MTGRDNGRRGAGGAHAKRGRSARHTSQVAKQRPAAGRARSPPPPSRAKRSEATFNDSKPRWPHPQGEPPPQKNGATPMTWRRRAPDSRGITARARERDPGHTANTRRHEPSRAHRGALALRVQACRIATRRVRAVLVRRTLCAERQDARDYTDRRGPRPRS